MLGTEQSAAASESGQVSRGTSYACIRGRGFIACGAHRGGHVCQIKKKTDIWFVIRGPPINDASNASLSQVSAVTIWIVVRVLLN